MAVRYSRGHSHSIRRGVLVLIAIFALVAAGLVPGDRFVGILPTLTAGDGSVSLPDHPDVTSFNPNQIKDIKAADPGSGINLIQAPTANNQGDARLSYPIEVPAG